MTVTEFCEFVQMFRLPILCPQRRDDLVRELEAATAIWERAEFAAAVKPLRRDLAFRWAIRRALKTKATTHPKRAI